MTIEQLEKILGKGVRLGRKSPERDANALEGEQEEEETKKA
jgi:hypothetical protein